MPDPLNVALAAADQAESILRRHFVDLGHLRIENKTRDAQDQGLVTDADLESEQAIVQSIRSAFPKHQILAEEEHTSAAGAQAEHLWIIDPLDGTNNFAHGLPHYAISIAYYRRGEPQIGLVVQPETGDRYWAKQGEGSWQRSAGQPDRRLRVSAANRLDQTLVGVGFYYDRGQMMRDTLAAIERLFGRNVHGIRRMGTAALDLVQVARGQFGGFFEYHLAPWDVAAGRLIVEEAGGRVTDCQGQPLPLAAGSLLASNRHLHDELLEQVQRSGPVKTTPAT